MSFGYPPMGGGSHPMHQMVPLLGSMGSMPNMRNGHSFLSQIGPNGSSSVLAVPQSPPVLTPANQNDKHLEYKNKAKNALNQVLEQQRTTGGCGTGQMGAGPMDLENENDVQLVSETSYGRNDRAKVNDRIDLTNTVNNHQQPGPNKNLEMILNGMMPTGMQGMQHNLHPNAGQTTVPTHPSAFMMMQGMMMDPATMQALQMHQFPMLGGGMSSQQQPLNPNSSTGVDITQSVQQQPTKEIITCKTCILFPPNPTAPPPTTRERPLGCRTVFVGGLPENITEDIIREIFDRCGDITTLRLSKKNFCHIRFAFEASVDSAIYLSGYRVRIQNNSEAAFCGRLHVDFAQARDDQFEYECKQRQLQREQRHRERMEKDRLRPVSPPPIVHYTDHEASNVCEKLKTDETFLKAVQTLIVWLERGDCSKKNSNTFYSMIQSTNSHVRRLQTDKAQHEEELRRAREQHRKQMIIMNQQFTQIEKVFNAASHKKVWDHFTKAQRKNIDNWKKQSTESRSSKIDVTHSHEEDEMEMSDDDVEYRGASKRTKYDNENLKEENDNLRCQLEAYKNEVNLVKSDIKSDTDIKEQQMKVLQETIRNLQTQLFENKAKEKDFNCRINDLESRLKQASVKELLLKTKIVEASAKLHQNSLVKSYSDNEETSAEKVYNNTQNIAMSPNINEDKNDVKTIKALQVQGDSGTSVKLTKTEQIDGAEARIIGVVSTFLVVHPFGASSDYICSYLQRIQPSLKPRELEEILSRYSQIFCEETTGVGAKIERKWKFCGYENNSSKYKI